MSATDMLDRFSPIRELGRGGMGTVFLVYDRLRQQEVALKAVTAPSPTRLLRLKREFRSVAPLAHANLVKLHDLGENEQGPFFTMEFVRGPDLRAFCVRNARATTDEERVRLVLDLAPQILSALTLLHERGILHRDLKPSNIMLSSDGVVKVLDFGISTREKDDDVRRSERRLIGTPRYMAPEQLARGPVTAASDMYSLGAILFELAALRAPFEANADVGRTWQTPIAPPSLAAWNPSAPRALVGLCEKLLDWDPEKRPSAHEALAALSSIKVSQVTSNAIRPKRQPLVGRNELKPWLEACLERIRDGQFGENVLEGFTGSGKSAVLQWLCERARESGSIVLCGQGRPNEHLSYNALDAAIDTLANIIHDMPKDGELAAHVRMASLAFPILADVASRPADGSRRAAFDALIQILASLAGAEGLLLVIDDLQWADADSLAFLDRLIEVSPPGVGLFVALRNDVSQNPAAEWLDGRSDVARHELAPLQPDAIARIIENTLQSLGDVVRPDVARQFAPSCAGLPFLAEVVGHMLSRGERETASVTASAPQDVPLALLRSSTPLGKELLALLLAADGWTPVSKLTQLAGRSPGDMTDELVDLEGLGLVRRAGPQRDENVSLYHDVVRHAASVALDPELVKRSHGAHVDWLLAQPTAEPSHLVGHLLGAGRHRDAAEMALIAARKAEAEFAFGLAADLYAVTLAHLGHSAPALLRARAAALAKVGHQTLAAECWRELAVISEESRTEAIINEAAAYLSASDILTGFRKLEDGFRESGLPMPYARSFGALFDWIKFKTAPLLGWRRPARRASPAPSAITDLHNMIRIGEAVGYFDLLSGIRVLVRARRHAYRIGQSLEAARCNYALAYFALFTDGRRGSARLSERYAFAARACLADAGMEGPELTALQFGIDGYNLMRSGRWDDAKQALDHAVASLVGCGQSGSFLHMFLLGRRYEASGYAQDFDGATRTWSVFRSIVRERHESQLHLQYRFGEVALKSFRGEVDLEELREISALWPTEVPTVQRMLVDYYSALPDLVHGDGRLAWRRIQRLYADHRAYDPEHGVFSGMFAAAAALAEVNALRSGDGEASPRRIRRLSAVARHAPPFVTARASRALAYLDDADGRPDRAVARLQAARRDAMNCGQSLDVAVAEYQLGKRLGGTEGAELQTRGRTAAEALGVAWVCLEEDAGLR